MRPWVFFIHLVGGAHRWVSPQVVAIRGLRLYRLEVESLNPLLLKLHTRFLVTLDQVP